MTTAKPIDEAPRQAPAVSSPATENYFARRLWLLASVLMVVAFVAYQPVWRAGFIWDDDQYFTQNPVMLSISGLRLIWSSLTASRFVPLTLTSFWVERRFWGLHPLPYHLINVGLHASNAVLLWTLLRRLRIRGAWLAAAVWALHPVNTETVAWVTELKNTQSGLFFLLALLVFLRFEDGSRPRDYAVALVLGAAAMLSKPSTVVLPGVMLLCAWWRRGRWTRNDFRRVAPLVAVAAAMSLVTIVEQRKEIAHTGTPEWALTAAQRLMIAGRAPWFYAGKVLWPADLCFVYPRWELAAHSVMAWLPLAGLALLAATLWQFRRARWAQAAIFGLGWFVIALLPVLGFFNTYFFRYSFVSDHFQYLACIGLISLAVSTGTTIWERAGQRVRDFGVVAAGILLLALGVSTWRQAHIYQNVGTLWRDTLMKNPRCWMAHTNLGLVLAQTGRIEDAIAHYEQALRIKPDHAEAHNNLGMALAQMGRSEDAIAQYQQALRIKPDFAEAHNNLGVALAHTGKISDAIAHYEQALRIKPDFAEVHCNLAHALERTRRVHEAIEHYEQALRANPDYAPAQNNLARLLATLAPADGGDPVRAVSLAEQACQLTRDRVAPYLDTLAAAYASVGRFTDAVTIAQAAVDLARSSGQTQVAAEIQQHLQLYRSGRAYRPSTGVTSLGNP